jgi:hypothetical protein
MGDKNMSRDKRNVDVLIKVANLLDECPRMEVAYSNPESGNLLIRYNDVCYELSISPMFTKDGDEKFKFDKFEEIANSNMYRLK